jgi:hypothetical protein
LRGSWASGGAVVGSVAFIVSVIGFFLMYISPYDWGRYDRATTLEAASNRWLANESRNAGVGAVVLFALLTAGAAMWLARNARVPRGGWLVLFATPALLQAALVSFEPWHRVLGAVAAGIVAELSWSLLLPSSGSAPTQATRCQPATAKLAIWIGSLTTVSAGVFFGAVAWREGMGWSAELWAGSSVLAGLLCALMVVGTAGPQAR